MYSSHLTAWRKGSLRELASKKRGAKPAERHPLDANMRALEAQVARLEHELHTAHSGRTSTSTSCSTSSARYAVGWMVADRENSALAGRLIEETCHKQGVRPQVLTLHSDRGAPMTSKCTHNCSPISASRAR